jgi:hypothetical protein
VGGISYGNEVQDKMGGLITDPALLELLSNSTAAPTDPAMAFFRSMALNHACVPQREGRCDTSSARTVPAQCLYSASRIQHGVPYRPLNTRTLARSLAMTGQRDRAGLHLRITGRGRARHRCTGGACPAALGRRRGD